MKASTKISKTSNQDSNKLKKKSAKQRRIILEPRGVGNYTLEEIRRAVKMTVSNGAK